MFGRVARISTSSHDNVLPSKSWANGNRALEARPFWRVECLGTHLQALDSGRLGARPVSQPVRAGFSAVDGSSQSIVVTRLIRLPLQTGPCLKFLTRSKSTPLSVHCIGRGANVGLQWSPNGSFWLWGHATTDTDIRCPIGIVRQNQAAAADVAVCEPSTRSPLPSRDHADLRASLAAAGRANI